MKSWPSHVVPSGCVVQTIAQTSATSVFAGPEVLFILLEADCCFRKHRQAIRLNLFLRCYEFHVLGRSFSIQ